MSDEEVINPKPEIEEACKPSCIKAWLQYEVCLLSCPVRNLFIMKLMIGIIYCRRLVKSVLLKTQQERLTALVRYVFCPFCGLLQPPPGNIMK